MARFLQVKRPNGMCCVNLDSVRYIQSCDNDERRTRLYFNDDCYIQVLSTYEETIEVLEHAEIEQQIKGE